MILTYQRGYLTRTGNQLLIGLFQSNSTFKIRYEFAKHNFGFK